MTKKKSRNVALVGCGAIAQNFYLPALAKRRMEFDGVWVVDPIEKARGIACSLVIAKPACTLSQIEDDLHFVIVASPNSSHFSVAVEALSREANVLIEKPFVVSPDEGRELIGLSQAKGRLVAVNQTRRFFRHMPELRERIAKGEFGALQTIVHNEGVKLSWPFASGARFTKDAQRVGVVMDIGVHVLDLYQYLLKPDWGFVSATHDGFRGPEGLAELQLTANNAPVRVRLSHYYHQDRLAALRFEGAEVLIKLTDGGGYFLKGNSPMRRTPTVNSETIAEKVLMNFLAAVEGREAAVCDATASLPVIDILDEIYRRANHFPQAPGVV